MDYFKLLKLKKEPFSNSPDPEMFFSSNQHLDCLQKLELAIRLRRGLNVVIGEVGTGKSTLCRQLLRRLREPSGTIVAYLILDPGFTSAQEFVAALGNIFGLPEEATAGSEWQGKEAIKNHLFEQGIDKRKVLTLIIDEGQKLPRFAVEILRELLNYETNQHKLLQIVIFAQEEFKKTIAAQANFADRITTFYQLRPFGWRDTRRMILFRLSQASSRGKAGKFFTFSAILAIYRLTGGYPRKIVMLCSKVILALIIQNKSKATASLVLACARSSSRRRRWKPALLLPALLVVVAGLLLLWRTDQLPRWGRAGQMAVSLAALEERGVSAVAELASRWRLARPARTPAVVPPVAPPEGVVAPAGGGAEAEAEKAKTAEAAPLPPPPPVALESHPPPGGGETQPRVELPVLPEQLGQLRVQYGESLSKMIARVYGRFTQERLAGVLRANPALLDINHIPPQLAITFPRLESKGVSPTPNTFRVQLVPPSAFSEAYGFAVNYRLDRPLLRLLPLWRPQQDLAFVVLLEEEFPSREAALAEISQLPDALQPQAVVVGAWPAGTLFLR